MSSLLYDYQAFKHILSVRYRVSYIENDNVSHGKRYWYIILAKQNSFGTDLIAQYCFQYLVYTAIQDAWN